MQVSAAASVSLLQTVTGAPAQGGLAGLLPDPGGFGPAALLGDLGDEGGVDLNFLSAAYAPPAPPQRSSDAKRKDMLREVANAMGAHAGGDTASAKKLLGGLLAKDRTFAPAHQSLGQIALDEFRYEDAEKHFRQAHYFSPQSGFDSDADNAAALRRGDAAVFARARLLLSDSGTREDGIRLLVGLTNQSEKSSEARLMLSDALLKQGNAVEAVDQLRKALDTDDRGTILRIEGRVAGLVEAAPDSAILRNLLGQAQLKAGKAPEALASFQRATILAKDDPRFRLAEAPALVAVGREALQAQNLSAAMSAFEAALERDPVSELSRIGYAEGLFARGEYRNRVGASPQAVQDFANAARQLSGINNEELAGRIAAGAYRAGLRLEAQRIADGGRIGDEVLAFQAAYDLDPRNAAYKSKLAQTRNALGDEFLAQNKYKDAAHAYQRAYDLYPTNAEYRDNTVSAFRQWGEESMTHRRFSDAIQAFRTAYRVQPDSADARLELASAYNARGLEHLEAGRISAALADFREAIHYDPDNEDYQHNLEQVH